MRNLSDIDVNNKRVFVRADLNVPVLQGKIVDDFRIRKSFKTIDYLVKNGAKIIIASHIEGEANTLRPVYEYLSKKYKTVFIENYFPNCSDLEPYFKDGNIVLLENLRKYDEEKNNNSEFANSLAKLADIFVNEAFPASHRKHASIVGIPKLLPSFAGFVFCEEVKELSSAFNPEHPFIFILGGAKFETKLPLIEKFWNSVDTMFVGGALANDFLKARGYPIGNSLISKKQFDLSQFLTDKLFLPIDVVVTNKKGKENKFVEDVLPEDTIVDVGLETIAQFASQLKDTKFILWNGPLGNYENSFKDGTENLARAIVGGTARSIVGGGDTIASIASLGLEDRFSFISTGGGAMLDFLANETLPGIEALERHN